MLRVRLECAFLKIDMLTYDRFDVIDVHVEIVEMLVPHAA